MGERTRRGVFATLLTLALLSAVGLMASALVRDSFWRAAVQISGAFGAIVLGAACAICTWRWWVAAARALSGWPTRKSTASSDCCCPRATSRQRRLSTAAEN
jgi:hypothetical protein